MSGNIKPASYRDTWWSPNTASFLKDRLITCWLLYPFCLRRAIGLSMEIDAFSSYEFAFSSHGIKAKLFFSYL